MSFRHLKIAVTIPCLAAAAVSMVSGLVSQSSLYLSEIIRNSEAETEVSFRGSGRFDYKDAVAYRASGRFQDSIERYTISYRGSERGVETVAYRASGRFDQGFWNGSLSSEASEQHGQTVAYRASGRFDSGLAQDVISYRGSERGIEVTA